MTNARTDAHATGLDGLSRAKLARWAGAAYLTYIAFGAAGMILQNRQISWGDLALNFHRLQQGIQLFRLGFFLEIVATMFFLLATWSYFVLLKPVEKNLALLLVLMNLGGIAAECASAIVKYGALQCVLGADLLHGFTPDQMQSLCMLLVRVGGAGFNVATLFYGAWRFPFGWLVYRSGFIPCFWGVLLIVDGVLLFISFAQQCLFPNHGLWTTWFLPIELVAEVGTAVWLVIMGARETPMTPSAAPASV
ncbi:MAG: DUF4386 domain-containing protein [Terracidiphilus sp.]